MDDKGVGAGEGRKTNKDTVMGRSNGRGSLFVLFYFLVFIYIGKRGFGGNQISTREQIKAFFLIFDFRYG